MTQIDGWSVDGNLFINMESLKTSCRELPQDSKKLTTTPLYRIPRQNKENLNHDFLLNVVDENRLLNDDLQVKTKVWTHELRLESFDKEVEQTAEDSKY